MACRPSASAAQPGDKEGNSITSLNARGGLRHQRDAPRRRHRALRHPKSGLDGQAFGFPIAGRTYDDASETSHEQLTVGASAIIDPWDGAWETTLSASHVDESRRSFSPTSPS